MGESMNSIPAPQPLKRPCSGQHFCFCAHREIGTEKFGGSGAQVRGQCKSGHRELEFPSPSTCGALLLVENISRKGTDGYSSFGCWKNVGANSTWLPSDSEKIKALLFVGATPSQKRISP